MSLEERKIWVDGRLEPWERVTVHVLSQSVQRGSLVFDVMPCYWQGESARILGMREHVDRFLRSARLNGMEVGLDRDAIVEAIRATVRANPGAEIVKISGYHPGIALDVLPISREPSVAIAAFRIAEVVPSGGRASFGARLARLQIASAIKMPPRVLSPQVKIAAGYTHAALAKRRARDEGFDDVLFLDENDCVAESSTQSFFLAERGVIRTAPTDTVLAGITRALVIELIQAEGIPFEAEPIARSALDVADEAFLTGTSIDVWPVARIDQRELPEPLPGPLTSRLVARFRRVVAGDDPEHSPRWMQDVV
jgi:branched-chain amino acid aminotransferase